MYKPKVTIYFTFVLIFVGSSLAYSQLTIDTVKIKLTKNEGIQRGAFLKPGKSLTDFSSYLGIPDTLERVYVLEYIFDYAQHLYDNYSEGKISKNEYNELLENYKLKKSVGIKNYRYKVAVLSGIKGQTKYIWCDSDNDKDFSNDSVTAYNLEALREMGNIPRDSIRSITIVFDRLLNDKIYSLSKRIKLIPYSNNYKFKNPIDEQLQVYYSSDEHQLGNFTVNNKAYEVKLPAGSGNDYDMIYLSENGLNLKFTPWIQIGDTVTLNETHIVFYELSDFSDSLTIIKLGEEKIDGIHEGQYSTLPAFLEIRSNETFNPAATSKKYILLDFWGTWCKPCLEQIPDLHDMINEYSNEIEVISIAKDDDVNKVKDFINKFELNWIHKFEPSQDEEWIKKLNVYCYPTLILLSNDFRILKRGCGESALSDIRSFLESRQ